MVAICPAIHDPIPQVRALLHGRIISVVGGDTNGMRERTDRVIAEHIRISTV